MRKVQQAGALLIAVFLGLGALYVGLNWSKPNAPAVRLEPAQAMSSGVFFTTRFPDLANKSRALGEWQGKVLVLNFWATWCEPCREEIPAFVRLQEKFGANGVQFIGLALDERDKADAFSQQFKVNYPILIGDETATEFGRRLGNSSGGVPFTVVIDRAGKIASRHIGPVREAELAGILGKVLETSAKR